MPGKNAHRTYTGYGRGQRCLFIVFFLMFIIPAQAFAYIIGNIQSVDTSGNIVVEIPEGKGPVHVGDKIEVDESVLGGMAVVLLGEWKVVEVDGQIVKADVFTLESDSHLPKAGMRAIIYPAGPAGSKDPLPVRRQKNCDNGDMRACTELGLMYKNGDRVSKDPQKAFELIRQAAEQGYEEAQFQLNYLFRFGTGVPASTKNADQWLLQAAENGYAKAQNAVGFHYIINKDYTNAEKWYRRAAEQEDHESQGQLGVIFNYDRYGDDGRLEQKADYAKAARWFKKAAEGNYMHAQENLAELYDWGRGVPKDKNEAIKWYRRAAAQGSDLARSALEKKGVSVEDPAVETKVSILQELEGVQVVDLTPELRKEHDIYELFKGVLITEVESGSLAAKLLLPRDLIMRINGIRIKNKNAFETFASVYPLEGDELIVYVKRDSFFVDVSLPSSVHEQKIEKAESINELKDPGTEKTPGKMQQEELQDDEWGDL